MTAEIEAMRWDGTAECATRIIDWILSHGGTARYVCSDPVRCEINNGDTPHAIAIDIPGGIAHAYLGDEVVRSAANEFYPRKSS